MKNKKNTVRFTFPF